MFDNAVFSNDGLELLGQLTATKTLVIREVYADTTQLDASLVNNSVEWWETQTAPTMQNIVAGCEAASKFDGQARLLLTFGGGEATVKTIVVTACAVESGVYTDEVVLCMASDDVGIKVFDTTSMYVYTNVALMIKFSNASSISIQGVSSTEFALQGDLDRLVSCHKAGDPSTGEAQTILGDKTFKHNISAHIAGFARINAENVGETVFIGNTMHPTVANTDLGTADYPFNNVQSATFTANKDYKVSGVGTDSLTYTTYLTPEYIQCTGTYGAIVSPIVTKFKFSKNDIYLSHNAKALIEFHYDTDKSYYTSSLTADEINLKGEVTCDDLHANSLIVSGFPIQPPKVEVNTSTQAITLSTGQIIMAYVDWSTFGDSSAVTYWVGHVFQVTSTTKMYIARTHSNGSQSLDVLHKLPVGKYLLLNTVELYNANGAYALVQKIS